MRSSEAHKLSAAIPYNVDQHYTIALKHFSCLQPTHVMNSNLSTGIKHFSCLQHNVDQHYTIALNTLVVYNIM